MRRYRTLFLILLFGVLPMVLTLVLAVMVLLPSLRQPEVAEEQEEPVVQVAVEVEEPPPPVMKLVAVVAARPLRPGTLLTTGDVTVSEIHEADLFQPAERYVYVGEVEQVDEAVNSRTNRLRGYAVRRTMVGGDLIPWAAVVAPGDPQFIATVLKPDRVAVSIPVSLATRQARLISPGHHVDVLLAVRQDNKLLVRTIVEDARVIAVNSRVISRLAEQGRTTEDEPTPAPAVAPDRPEVTTVTLEVLPVQGEHLALGAYEGQLSLALRPHAGPAERLTEPLQDMRSVLRLPEEEPPEIVPPVRPACYRQGGSRRPGRNSGFHRRSPGTASCQCCVRRPATPGRRWRSRHIARRVTVNRFGSYARALTAARDAVSARRSDLVADRRRSPAGRATVPRMEDQESRHSLGGDVAASLGGLKPAVLTATDARMARSVLHVATDWLDGRWAPDFGALAGRHRRDHAPWPDGGCVRVRDRQPVDCDLGGERPG